MSVWPSWQDHPAVWCIWSGTLQTWPVLCLPGCDQRHLTSCKAWFDQYECFDIVFIDYLSPPVLLGGSAQSHLLLQGHTRPPETNSPCGEVPDNKSYRLFCLLVSLLSATFLTLMRMSHLQGCTPLWCRLVSFPDPQCESGIKSSATL